MENIKTKAKGEHLRAAEKRPQYKKMAPKSWKYNDDYVKTMRVSASVLTSAVGLDAKVTVKGPSLTNMVNTQTVI